jgi:ATP-dependent Clp protease ATP-binding subunit ClpB
LNRVDEIVLFHRLQRADMGAIVDIQMLRLAKLLEDRKITVHLDESGREWLAERGYDPAYGARPLKRVIQKAVQDPMAERILAGQVKDGDIIHITGSATGLLLNGEMVESTMRTPDHNADSGVLALPKDKLN